LNRRTPTANHCCSVIRCPQAVHHPRLLTPVAAAEVEQKIKTSFSIHTSEAAVELCNLTLFLSLMSSYFFPSLDAVFVLRIERNQTSKDATIYFFYQTKSKLVYIFFFTTTIGWEICP
jgi:hypothetical protein